MNRDHTQDADPALTAAANLETGESAEHLTVAKQPRQPMLKQLIVGLLLVGLFSLFVWYTGRPAPTPEVFREGVSLIEAMDIAAAEDKPVFAVVTADWCGPCQNYKRGALADERVQAWLGENAVAVMLDADTLPRNEAMLLNFGGSIPATVMLNDGRVVGAFEGSMGAGFVRNWLEESAAK
jgi:thiol:disulfide interchange protein